jgi:hypothetical protein
LLRCRGTRTFRLRYDSGLRKYPCDHCCRADLPSEVKRPPRAVPFRHSVYSRPHRSAAWRHSTLTASTTCPVDAVLPACFLARRHSYADANHIHISCGRTALFSGGRTPGRRIHLRSGFSFVLYPSAGQGQNRPAKLTAREDVCFFSGTCCCGAESE